MSNDDMNIIGAGLLAWHRALTGKTPSVGSEAPAEADGKPRPGALAVLRRARTPADVLLCPAFAELVDLCHPGARPDAEKATGRAKTAGLEPWELESLARTAFLAARLERCRIGVSFAARMAEPRRGSGTDPVVSRVRADALFRTADADDACRQIAMLLPLAGESADPRDLYKAMRYWDIPLSFDSARHRWAMAYHLAVQKMAAQQNPAQA